MQPTFLDEYFYLKKAWGAKNYRNKRENQKTGNSARYLCAGPRNVERTNAHGVLFLRMKRGEFVSSASLCCQTNTFVFFWYTT